MRQSALPTQPGSITEDPESSCHEAICPSRDLADHVLEGICILDVQGVIVRANAMWARITRDRSGRGGVGESYIAYCRSKGVPVDGENNDPAFLGEIAKISLVRAMTTRAMFDSVLATGEEVRIVYSRSLGGKEHWFLCRAKRLETRGDRYVMVSHLDVTPMKAAVTLKRLHQTLFEHGTRSTIVTDAQGLIVATNPAFSRITGYAPEEAVGKSPKLLSSGSHDGDFYKRMWEVLARDGVWHGEVLDRRKNGEVFPARLSITAVKDPYGDVSGYIGISADLSREKDAEDAYAFLANYDQLTSLLNRSSALSSLNEMLSKACDDAEQVALLLIDIDGFADFNEVYGQKNGDELLIEVSSRIRSVIGPRHILARVGSDEFLVAMSGVGKGAAIGIAESIQKEVAAPIYLYGDDYHVTASVGISTSPDDGLTSETLLQKANSSLCEARSTGRAKVLAYSPLIGAAVSHRVTIRNDLTHALDRGEMHLAFQPQVCSSTGRIVGAEALLRWHRRHESFVSPAEFIPIAEESGLIIQIGEWVMKEACKACAGWQKHVDFPLRVAVNLSAVQFRDPGLTHMIQNALSESGLSPSLLEVELTESTLVTDFDQTDEILRSIGKMGVEVAIDDFGTGYSSLGYLHRLNIQKLKIDRSFLPSIENDIKAARVARSVISIAKNFGLRVIAEGVEERHQVEFLQDEGCSEIQGYIYSKPLPLLQFTELARENRGFVEQRVLSNQGE